MHGARVERTLSRGRVGRGVWVLALLAAALFAAADAGQAQPATTDGQWEATGRLSVARYDHTTTLLTNGRVLAAGGRLTSEPAGVLHSAEVYHPQSGEWKATGALAEGRWSHTATRLRDGRVLVAGGFTNPYNGGSNAQPVSSTAEIYDPGQGTWTTTGEMNVRRALHTATLLPDGTVLVAGGRTCSDPPPTACNFLHRTNTAEVYDPASGTWTMVAPLAHNRHTTSAALLHDGTVLVPAGFSEEGNSRTAEIYDPATGSWRLTGNLNIGRARQGAMLLHDGRVLVAAGFGGENTSEVYDPDIQTWTFTGNVAVARRFNFRYQVLPDGRALIAGGAAPGAGAVASVELYDPATGTWTLGPDMPAVHGSGSSLSKTDEAVVLGPPRSTSHAPWDACGPVCGKVLVAGNNPDGATSLYTPGCPARTSPPSGARCVPSDRRP